MSKYNYSVMVRTLLENLQERKLVPMSYKFISGKGLARVNSNIPGNYSMEETGNAKDIYYFLCGIQHAQMLALPCNQNVD